MSSSFFGDNVNTYAPGISTGMPTDALQFLQNFTNKKGKIKKRALKQFKDEGGDVQGVRDILEGNAPSDFQGPLPEYYAGGPVTQAIQNQTATMDAVAKNKKGKPRVGSFIDEYMNAKGKVSRKDMEAFKAAGGNIKKLDRKLQEGNFTREEMLADPSVLNERGSSIRAGQDDYYTGQAGKRFLDSKLRGMGVTPESDEESSKAPDDPTFFDSTPEEPSVPPGTGGGTDPDPGTGTDPGTGGGTDPDPTTPTTGDGTDPSPIPILETGNEYPDTDPGSGFPTNPGRHPGGAFTPYKENISDILKHTDERLDRIRNRVSSQDTLTHSLTRQLMDSGVLPGSEGYKSPAEKDAERLAGDLAIKDAFSKEETDRRRDARKLDLEMLRENAAIRRQEKDQELRDRQAAMLELQAANRPAPASILDYMGTPSESGGPAPIDLTKPDQKSDKEKFNLPGLPDKPEGKAIEGPGIYKKGDGKSAPDYEKNTTFDGRSFGEFLKMAQEPGIQYVKGMEREYGFRNPALNRLYTQLQAEGLSDNDMLEAARSAGLTNVRTGKEGKSDYEQILDAYENDFYKDFDKGGKKLKSEQDLYRWYKGQGGTKKLDNIRKKAGYKVYDSKNDANKLVNYFTDDLRKAGITTPASGKSMSQFNKAMDNLQKTFGGNFKFKTYQEALEGNKASDVNDWVKNYINLGGGVGRKVTDAIGL